MSTKEDLLLAEIADLREQLYRAENPAFNGRLDSWQAACGKARGESESLRNELRELKAENDALRQDAERYKFLMLSFVGDEGSPQAGYYVIYEDGSGFGEILCGDEATREIDTAMAQGAQS